MLVLFETPAGYSIFRLSSTKKLNSVENIASMFNKDNLNQYVEFKCMQKFKETSQAVKSLTKIKDQELPDDLSRFLQKNIISKDIKESLLCYDSKLANLIKTNLDIKTEFNSKYLEVFRGIRSQLTNLIDGLNETDFKKGSVGLSHNFYRHKLKFSIDKVDVMVIQAVGLLEDLDKELNNYCMRLREWYGWHFPECGKIIADNLTYAKVVQAIGMRIKTKSTNLSEILTPDDEAQIKEAAEISMGSEIAEEDEFNIKELCAQIIYLYEYRASLAEYLKNRMMAIAPNLTIMVGELVAALLIAHAGSIVNLAKLPASTIQIFGAEKALFRALRTKHDTPKYGLIYRASLVGKADTKLRGKIARSLAAKCALCIRVDALGESAKGAVGMQSKKYIEARIASLEEGMTYKDFRKGKKLEKYVSKGNKEVEEYNQNEEVQLTKKKRKRKDEDNDDEEVDDEEKIEAQKPKKKKTQKE